MSRDRDVKASPHGAKDRHDARPLLLAQAVPASRSLLFVLGTTLVAALGLVVAFAVAPDTTAVPAPAAQTVVPSSTCERALAANLDVAHRALADFTRGRSRAGRDLYLSRTAALPKGCPS